MGVMPSADDRSQGFVLCHPTLYLHHLAFFEPLSQRLMFGKKTPPSSVGMAERKYFSPPQLSVVLVPCFDKLTGYSYITTVEVLQRVCRSVHALILLFMCREYSIPKHDTLALDWASDLGRGFSRHPALW